MAAVEGSSRLLVTGGTGELGRALARVLEERGGTRFLSRRPRGDDPRIVCGDLGDAPSLHRACEGIDVVLHMAAVTHAYSVAEYFAVNVGGTANLLAAARSAGVRRFVHLSTRALGAEGGGYSHSKSLAEAKVRESAVPWVILRPAEIYGAGGDDPISRLAAAVRARKRIPVLGDGSFRVCPVHAEDVAMAVVRSLDAPAAEGGAYVLAGPREMSYLELIECIERAVGVGRSRRVHVPVWLASVLIRAGAALRLGRYVPDQIPRLRLAKTSDSSSAIRDLGFCPRPLEEGLG